LKEYVLEQNKDKIRDLSGIRERVAEKIERARANGERYVNSKRKAAREYVEGDLVVVKNFETADGKLTPSYREPYRNKIIKKRPIRDSGLKDVKYRKGRTEVSGSKYETVTKHEIGWTAEIFKIRRR